MSLHLFFVPIRSIPSSKPGLPPQLTRKSIHCTRTRLRFQSSKMADQDSQQTSQRRSANYQLTAWDSDFIKSLKNHDVWVDLCKAILVEAKWCFEKETPTFKAYLDNGLVSASMMLVSVHAYFLLTETITKKALEWFEKKESYHPLILCPSLIFRLCNDLATSKAELKRGESANSIMCYMHETGLSEQEAEKHIRKLIDEAWKKMNKERVPVDSPFEKPFTETAINFARMAQCSYQNGDGLGAPDNQVKNWVLSVIIEPITTSC